MSDTPPPHSALPSAPDSAPGSSTPGTAPASAEKPGTAPTSAEKPGTTEAGAAKVKVPGIVRDDQEKPQAIIYLPNLKPDPEAETIATVAHRIALAMDNISGDRGASFSAVTAADAAYDGVTTHTAIVRKKDAAGKQTDVIHLYEFDYRPTLLDGFQKRQPVVQAAQILLTLLGNAWNFVVAFVRRGQSPQQKLQVLYGGVLAAGMLLYMLMLLGTAAVTARHAAVGPSPSATREAAKGTTPAVNAPVAAATGTAAAPGSAQPGAAAVAGNARPAGAAAAKPAAVRRLRDLVRMPASPLAAPAAQPRPAPSMAPAPQAAPREKLPPFPVWLFQRAKFLLQTWGGFVLGVAWFLVTWPILRIGEGVLLFWNMSTDRLHQLQSIVITFTVLGLTVRVSLKEVLSRMSTTTTCASNYLAYGIGRNELVGHMARLLDHVGSREVQYRNVHLVGYSFGSIVALDSVYQDSAVSAAFDQVSTISTIACPADFIRTYWRDYFVDRHEAKRAPGMWVNVYAPRDVLASNFVDGRPLGIGAADGEAVAGGSGARGQGVALVSAPGTRVRRRWSLSRVVAAIRNRSEENTGTSEVKLDSGDSRSRLPHKHVKFGPAAPRGFLGWAFFIVAVHGFRAHERYWTRGINTAKTCWEPLLAELYPYERPEAVSAETDAHATAGAPAAPVKPAPPAEEPAAKPAEPLAAVG